MIPVETRIVLLNKNVRCDACNAQAYVLVTKGTSASLTFCAHDYVARADSLADQGFIVAVDQRWELHK